VVSESRQVLQEVTVPPGRWLRRKTIVVPTWRTWLLLTVFCALGVGLFATQLPGFLAVTEPIPSEILVVEGWVPDYALDGAVAEFGKGHYTLIVTSGGPLDRLTRPGEGESYATLAAEYLRRCGIPSEKIRAVSSPRRLRNRTYESAVAFRDFLRTSQNPPKAINLYTLGFHARRSRNAFERAIGPGTAVGVIAHPPRDFQVNRWWRASDGAKSFVNELIGFVYFRFFFAEP